MRSPLEILPSSMRRLGLLLPTLSLLALLQGCGGKEPASSAEKVAAGAQDTLVVAVTADAESFLPILAAGQIENMLADNLYQGLIQADFDCELKYRPGIAKSWEFLPDGRSVRFELDKDLKWSDGEPIVVEDVLFSFDLVADPEVGSPRIGALALLEEGARPKVEEDGRLTFTFKSPRLPSAMLFDLTVIPILPKHALVDQDRKALKASAFNKDPVTSGAWKLQTWERGARIVLAPNPYFKKIKSAANPLQRIVFVVQPDYATSLMELKAGKIDLLDGVQVHDADSIRKENPNVRLETQGWRVLDYLGWNEVDRAAYKKALGAAGEKGSVETSKLPRNPLFGDVATRRALARAIDTERLIRDVLSSREAARSFGQAAVGTYTPALCKLRDLGPKALSFDLAIARKELEDAGWKDLNGDGIVERGGRPLAFDLMLPSTNPRKKAVASILQSTLKQAGVDMRVDLVDTATFRSRQSQRDFDAIFGSWGTALAPEPATYWRSGPNREYNAVSYQNAAVDLLIDEAEAATNEEAALALHQRILQTVYEDQPYAFLYWYDNIVALDNRVEGASINQISPVFDLYSWSVPPERVKYK